MNYSRGTTSEKEGLEWLEKILHIDPEARVLTTTAYGEIGLAVQAMKKVESILLQNHGTGNSFSRQ